MAFLASKLSFQSLAVKQNYINELSAILLQELLRIIIIKNWIYRQFEKLILYKYNYMTKISN